MSVVWVVECIRKQVHRERVEEAGRGREPVTREEEGGGGGSKEEIFFNVGNSLIVLGI